MFLLHLHIILFLVLIYKPLPGYRTRMRKYTLSSPDKNSRLWAILEC